MPIDSLDKAITLHAKHMEDPKTATMKSQEVMMQLMKKHRQEMPGKKAAMGKVKMFMGKPK